MTNERHDDPERSTRPAPQLEQLIFECLERMETEGEAALEALCAQHPAQSKELRARLHTLRGAGLIETAGAAAAPAFPERLGDFRLLEHLGGGGMGVVYLARQESLGREVALKLIRPEQLFFPGARERFRREVETVARLNHPGIVPIHTVGDEGGIPYFAMERVVGGSLADVIDHLQDESPSKLSGADFDRAIAAHAHDAMPSVPAAVFAGRWHQACLRIVREAAEALEYVHRRGVLHRDIKPSNVMLTRGGRVMLVDFGLASAEGSARMTRTGSQLGSLAYMAPEQLRGDTAAIDARSDVYSLGVTLYELLTLRLPFVDPKQSELRRQIAEGRPPAPSTRNQSLDRDVETVCLHAMANDPKHRYASAAEFAQDLTNALEKRPISARRAGAFERVVRWTRRQPALAAAMLLAFALVTVLPTALYLQQRGANAVIQAKNAEIEASNQSLATALQDAKVQNQRAEENLGVAMESVDSMLSRVGAQDLEQVPQFERVRAKLLESALALNEKLAAGQGDERPEARASLAETRRRAGEIYRGLGRFDDAIRMLGRAVADRRALLGTRGQVDDRAGLAMALDALARTQRAIGQHAASAESSREAIELLGALPSDGAAGEVRLDRRAQVLHFRATTLFLMGQIEPALAAHREAIDVARQLFARAPLPDREVMVASYLGAMGSLLLEQGQNEACAKALREACAIYERVLPQVESAKSCKENFGDACTNLGVLHQNEQDLGGAAPHFERAFTLYAELAAAYPNSPRYLDSLNAARNNLATLRMAALDTRATGVQLMRDAVASQQGLVARFPKSTEYRTLLAMMVGNLGTWEHGAGDSDRGYELLGCALTQHGALLAEQPGNPVLQSRALVFGLQLASLRLQDGDSRAAAAALRTTESLAAQDWITLRKIAGMTMAASEAARGDTTLAAAERDASGQQLLDHAIDLMERSIAAGYRDVADLEGAPIFEPLRASPRYPALRAKLPAASK